MFKRAPGDGTAARPIGGGLAPAPEPERGKERGPRLVAGPRAKVARRVSDIATHGLSVHVVLGYSAFYREPELR